MSRSFLVLAAAALPCALSLPTSQALAQIPQKIELSAARQMAIKISSSAYEKSISALGTCQTADANPMSRMIWAASLPCAGQGAQLTAGIRQAALTSAAAIPGARVVATFQSSRLSGWAKIMVSASKNGQRYGAKSQTLTFSSGTHFTLTSEPFTLEANQPFNAQAEVQLGPACNDICGIEVTVKEIKWEF